MKGLFVTGTDTNVGKTVASAALIHRYRALSSVRYWKPIQTGIEQDDDTTVVRNLGGCRENEIFGQGIRLPKPVSPNLAAQRAGVRIDLRELLALPQESDVAWIVEGAGGVLVPVNESETMADWMTLLGLPVLVIARTGLGTINHTLLTLEALRARALRVAGVLMIGEPNTDNREAIEKYGHVKVIAEMPMFNPLDCGMLAAWSDKYLDPSGLLSGHLR